MSPETLHEKDHGQTHKEYIQLLHQRSFSGLKILKTELHNLPQLCMEIVLCMKVCTHRSN